MNARTSVGNASANPPAIDLHHHGFGNHLRACRQLPMSMLDDLLIPLGDQFPTDLASQSSDLSFADVNPGHPHGRGGIAE